MTELTNCYERELSNGCFKPDDTTLPSEGVIIHAVYQDGAQIGYAYSLADGTLIDPATYQGGGVVSVGDCKCEWRTVGKELCYGQGGAGGTASYEIGADNESDGVFSIGGTGNDTIKWEVDTPAAAADGLAEFTLEIQACIDSGEIAYLTIEDSNGNIYTFPADAYSAGNVDGSGAWAFTGPGAPAGGSGKIVRADLSCGNPSSGKACYQEGCNGEYRWFDIINQAELTPEQIETLVECVPDADCAFTDFQTTACAVEEVQTVNGTTVNIGDQVLAIIVRDCNNVVINSTFYHIASQEEITEPVQLDQCDPEPLIRTTRDCFLDADGQQWSEVSIIDTNSVLILYYDADLNLGTPAGDPSEWISCDASTDCTACPPATVADTVCHDSDQTINGVLVEAGNPIIRKITTEYLLDSCECIEVGTVTRFFDFNDPSIEFTDVVTFSGECNAEIATVTRCDRNGQEVQVTTITVFTDDGGVTSTSYTDSNGEPIPEPLLPLSICNPDVEVERGCIEKEDGTIVRDVLFHIQYDASGRPDYTVSYYTTQTGMTSQFVVGDKFIPGCEWTEDCPLEVNEYCYDASTFTYPCTSSTIEIDGTAVDLCGSPDNGVFVTDGDICATGGIRSENDPVRHPNAVNNTGAGYDISLITSDALDVAGQIEDEGCIGGASQNGNQTVKALFGADVFGLSGTAPTITLGGEWIVGSGLGVGVYDCATNTILPFAPGETQPAGTYDLAAFGVEIYVGPTGGFGAAGAGVHTWQVDTSTVADLSTLVIYTVVLNPTGDALCGLTVNGVEASPQTCDVTDQASLIEILGQTTGTTWAEKDGLICTVSESVLGSLVCSTTSIDPVITTTTEERQIPLVKIACDEGGTTSAENTHVIKGCVLDVEGKTVDGYTVINDAGNALFAPRPLTDLGFVDCSCCFNEHKICVRGFDRNTLTEFEAMPDTGVIQWFIYEDNVLVAQSTDDPSSQDTGDKSSWYANLIANVNISTNFNMTVVNDVDSTGNDKPTFCIEYEGPGRRLQLTRTTQTSNDILTLEADGDGNWTTQTFLNNGNNIESNTFVACP